MSHSTANLNLGRLHDTFFNTEAAKRFHSPSRIYWGQGIFDEVVKALSGCSVVVFYDIAFELSKFLVALRASSAEGSKFFPVSAPPSPELVSRTVALLDGTCPSVIIALGGGSTIDTAKCIIAHNLYGSIDGIGMGGRRGELPQQSSPKPLLIAIPSTAGTGAESSRYFVTYSEKDHSKVHGKAWALAADWTFLDPNIALCAPKRVVYESALDAFVHSTESFLCMKESSWVNTALCLAAIKELASGLKGYVEGSDLTGAMLSMQSSSSVAGVAISNVRTGHIHEMAGAFLEHTGLSHPQTLAIFMREGLACLQDSPAGIDKLRAVSKAFGLSELYGVLEYWEMLLEEGGTMGLIRDRLAKMDTEAMAKAKRSVILRCVGDVVWARKECPVLLDEALISLMFDRSVARFTTTTYTL